MPSRYSETSSLAEDVGAPEAWQASLFGAADDAPSLGALAPERRILAHGAWIDLQPSWLSGADAVFEHLVREVPWESERREMYDAIVDTPRLLCFFGEGEQFPHPSLADARERLSAHYRDELGEDFTTAGLCYYRNGRDSVAWHGDTSGKGKYADTMVAIVSVGEARRLSLRPRGGGESFSVPLGHGDLIVMGGSCQRTWEHAILKSTRAIGPRISIQFRPHGVR